jgi:archaellum component FlaC
MPSTQNLILSDAVIKMLFDRFERSNDRNADSIVEVTKAINLLLKTIGRKPEEIKDAVVKIEEIVKGIENKFEYSEKSENNVVDNCKSIKSMIERIDRNIWKFYVVVGVVFTLGLTLLYLLIDLKGQLSAIVP